MGSQRGRERDNAVMRAVSQALMDFANQFRPEPGPGSEIIAPPRFRATIQPDFPIAGPNNASWIRCRPDEVRDVIREVRAIFASRHLPFMWTLDPGAQPADFADHLARHGVHPDPHGVESQVMVMSIEASVESPPIEGLEILDALVDLETFRTADGAAAEAFGQATPSPLQGRGSGGNQLVPSSSRSRAGAGKNDYIAMQDRRRLNFRAARNRHLLLATIDGKPAGAAGRREFPPAAARRPSAAGPPLVPAGGGCPARVARRPGASRAAAWLAGGR